MKKKKYAIGNWYHIFGAGDQEVRCRIVIDLEQSKLIAAQEWTGIKFQDVLGDRLKDLSESIIDVNQAHANVEEWAPDPEFADELPEWVNPRNLPMSTNKDAVNRAFKSYPEALLFNAVQLEKALTSLCNTINQRGELDQGGCDANTELATAYHKAMDVLRHREVTPEMIHFVNNFKG